MFLLQSNRKRVLVRVERATVFSVEEDNMLELADAYYLGGVPPTQLPPRWERRACSGRRAGVARGCGGPDTRPPTAYGSSSPLEARCAAASRASKPWASTWTSRG